MPEEIRLAETIWCDVGKNADVGAANENLSVESGKCVKDNPKKNVEDDPTKKTNIEDDALPFLSSDKEEEDTSPEDEETDKAILPDIETIKKRIPSVTNKVDRPTVTTSKKF